ncbi:hypothetical protein M3Y98_00913800 [Aphelenchoides besseyi]|nr:hypothetical protein M3Y98_00913800 [Aphelenchoides besseyi]
MSDIVADDQFEESKMSIDVEATNVPNTQSERMERGPVTPPEAMETSNSMKDESRAMKTENPTKSEIVDEIDSEDEEPIDTEERTKSIDNVVESMEPVAISEGELSSTGEIADDAERTSEEAKLKRADKKSRKRHKRNRSKEQRRSISEDENEPNGASLKRTHSQENEEKKKLEKLKEMKFGDLKSSGHDTRRFNFRQTAESKLSTSANSNSLDVSSPSPAKQNSKPINSNGRGPRTPEPSYLTSDENAPPVLKTLRQLRTMSLVSALDVVFSIPQEEMSVLSKTEMVEVLEIMYDLNKKRELLTSNRRRLTGYEARSICNTEIAILNDLEHLMNDEEVRSFHQLKQCAPSMDEMAPFDISIDPSDITLSSGSIRMHVVDLLPPADAPMIGNHDPSWDHLLKHIPMELRGVPPPAIVQDVQHVPPPQQIVFQEPPPQFIQPVLDQPAGTVFVPTSVAPPQPNGVHHQFVPQQMPPTELPPTSTVEINTLPPTNVPPPISQTMPMNFSVPPPAFVPANGPSEQPPTAPEPLSPISAFRNSLKQTSLLNSLVPSLNQSTSQPPPTILPAPDFMSGPPPQIPHHAAVSPNRCYTSMPPPTVNMQSRPIPLMSIEHPPGYSVPRLYQQNKFQSGPSGMPPPQHQRSRRGVLPSANFVPLSANPSIPIRSSSPAPSASSTVATMGSEHPSKCNMPVDPLPDSAVELASVTSTVPANSTIDTAVDFEISNDYTQSASMETPPHIDEESQLSSSAMPESVDDLPVEASAASIIADPPSSVDAADSIPPMSDLTMASADSTTALEQNENQ